MEHPQRESRTPRRASIMPSVRSLPLVTAPSSGLTSMMSTMSDGQYMPMAQKKMPVPGRKRTFALLFTIMAWANFDAGAVPASLDMFMTDFEMSKTEIGLMCSINYVGLALSATLSGPLLAHTQPKWVLVVSLFINVAFRLTFAFGQTVPMLVIARFLVGLTGGCLYIHLPVWVDEFSPTALTSTWLAVMQAGIPLGIMVGYATAGYLSANGYLYTIPFFLQAIVLFVLVIILAFVPVRYLDTRVTVPNRIFPDMNVGLIGDSLSTSGEQGLPPGPPFDYMARGHSKVFFGVVKALGTNGVYLATTFGLCSVYFIVTGLQMWITLYFIDYLNADKNVVVTAYTVTCATAPIAGVLLGGLGMDRLVRNRGTKSVLVATQTVIALGLVCIGSAVAVILLQTFWGVVVAVWFLLFFGGAIIPGATGVIISSVSREHRPYGLALSLLIYNLFGYFAGPAVAGIVADSLGGTEWGIRIVMAWTCVAFVFFVAAGVSAGYKYRELQQMEQASLDASLRDEEKLNSVIAHLRDKTKSHNYE